MDPERLRTEADLGSILDECGHPAHSAAIEEGSVGRVFVQYVEGTVFKDDGRMASTDAGIVWHREATVQTTANAYPPRPKRAPTPLMDSLNPLNGGHGIAMRRIRVCGRRNTTSYPGCECASVSV